MSSLFHLRLSFALCFLQALSLASLFPQFFLIPLIFIIMHLAPVSCFYTGFPQHYFLASLFSQFFITPLIPTIVIHLHTPLSFAIIEALHHTNIGVPRLRALAFECERPFRASLILPPLKLSFHVLHLSPDSFHLHLHVL